MRTHELPELTEYIDINTLTFQGSHQSGQSVHESLNLGLDTYSLWDLDNHTIGIVDNEVSNDEVLKKRAELVLQAGFKNSGQGSNSLKQLFIHEEVYDKFKELLTQGVVELTMGNPKEETTNIGPMCDKNYLVDGIEMVRIA